MNRVTHLKVIAMLDQVRLMMASLLMGSVILCGLSQPHQVIAAGDENPKTGIAVVELFTSQGCSSCPPADRVLEKLFESFDDSQPVYLLSFHVDYWNQLGWDDPYSMPISTEHQRAYARAWSSRRVYTPQMVVNGTWEFNGGNERKARLAIDEGLHEAVTSKIRLRTRVDAENSVAMVGYDIDGQIDDHVLNVALVSPHQENLVPRGENRGEKLRHVNVVRAFVTHSLEGVSGEVKLSFPADFDWKSGEVVAYVQRRADAVLTGAMAQSLKNR